MELATAICAAVTGCQDAAVIVITGADPAFCAGLNLRSLGTDQLADLPPFMATVAASAVPVIAAVNGPAVTGGFELALAADFIVASERAAFADTHLRVGVYPGPVLVDLPRRVGLAWAREMSLTGNFVDAATALRIGHRQPRGARTRSCCPSRSAWRPRSPSRTATWSRPCGGTGTASSGHPWRRRGGSTSSTGGRSGVGVRGR